MPIAYLCLGSNIEDRVSYVQQATNLLVNSGLLNLIRSSTIYETEPWGQNKQDWFLNAVIEVKTKLEPRGLLELCHSVEKQLGRVREVKEGFQPRTIDIDILLYGDLTINEPDLTIPHKHLHQRAFALVPLLELIPDYVHPKYNKCILDLHDEIECPEDVYLYGTRFDLDE